MASNSIERMLELNNMIEKGNATPSKTASSHRVTSQRDLDKLIESFDEQVYGSSAEPVLINENKKKEYDPRAEMEHLKEIAENGGRGSVNLEGRHIPKSIVESILNNPLDMKPLSDPRMDALTEKIAGKGIKAAVDVFNEVEKKEKEARIKLNEQLSPRSSSTNNIDYNEIKSLIESCIDNKLNEIKNALNESVSSRNAYVPSMKYLSFKDNFYFVDNDDNVFECVMKYKGKRKRNK